MTNVLAMERLEHLWAAKSRAIDDTGLAHSRHIKAGTLSLKQECLLRLALELLSPPRILFLDGLTSGLPDAEEVDVFKTLKQLSQKVLCCFAWMLAYDDDGIEFCVSRGHRDRSLRITLMTSVVVTDW